MDLFIFETTRFSTYAIASKNPNYSGGSNTGGTGTGNSGTGGGVKTGDTANAAVWMIFSLLGGGYIVTRVYKKAKKFK